MGGLRYRSRSGFAVVAGPGSLAGAASSLGGIFDAGILALAGSDLSLDPEFESSSMVLGLDAGPVGLFGILGTREAGLLFSRPGADLASKELEGRAGESALGLRLRLTTGSTLVGLVIGWGLSPPQTGAGSWESKPLPSRVLPKSVISLYLRRAEGPSRTALVLALCDNPWTGPGIAARVDAASSIGGFVMQAEAIARSSTFLGLLPGETDPLLRTWLDASLPLRLGWRCGLRWALEAAEAGLPDPPDVSRLIRLELAGGGKDGTPVLAVRVEARRTMGMDWADGELSLGGTFLGNEWDILGTTKIGLSSIDIRTLRAAIDTALAGLDSARLELGLEIGIGAKHAMERWSWRGEAKSRVAMDPGDVLARRTVATAVSSIGISILFPDGKELALAGYLDDTAIGSEFHAGSPSFRVACSFPFGN
jgi:hypothetical protein